jgi:hypothetical protein
MHPAKAIEHTASREMPGQCKKIEPNVAKKRFQVMFSVTCLETVGLNLHPNGSSMRLPWSMALFGPCDSMETSAPKL